MQSSNLKIQNENEKCKIVKERIDDDYFMNMALEEAKKALKLNILPVGAIIVLDKKVITKGRKQDSVNPRLKHAEMIALEKALECHYNLSSNMTLYTTLEPCIMCYGAILNGMIGRLVFALEDTYGGATGLRSENLPPRHHSRIPEIVSGVGRDKSIKLFTKFFKETKIPFYQNKQNPLVAMCLNR